MIMKKNDFTCMLNRGRFNSLLSVLCIFLIFGSCDKEDPNILWVSQEQIDFPAEGGATTVHLKTDALDGWQISNPASDWVELSQTSSPYTPGKVAISVSSKTLTAREAILTLSAGNASPIDIVITQPASDYLHELSADKTVFEANSLGNSATLKVSSTAPSWSFVNTPDWVTFSEVSGGVGDFTISVSILENETNADRSATVTLQANNTPSIEISFSQTAGIYPSYNLSPLSPDQTGMESSAVALAAKMKIGWNIGNTLEAIGGETAWGNPRVTEDLIKLVKQSGFNAIRIPSSWDQYMENSVTAEIKAEWLNRVKQVVEYCVNNDMYVIVNIHWDQGWLEENCTPDKQVEVNAKQKAFWEQIATHLRDFDEHLLFASANEPHVDNAEQMAVLQSYHQTFVNAVRSTGGKNSYRVLIVQGPATDIEKTNTLMTSMPTDEVAGRMMSEVHFYPYQFSLMTEDASWGKAFYYWGNGYHSDNLPDRNSTWGEEDFIDDMFGRMKTQFTDKGIPVVLGEFGAIKRTYLTGENLALHLASRAYYLKYVVKQAKANGMLPFYWDAGNIGEHEMTIFNRSNNTVHDQQALDALIEGANE
ncbi:cellulase family glycosylhydrolase [Flammeovirgaceae bacterium SG7u.111]|nr:cellulase family glycosylhydrolase [Flammeovirgaceae bacterium SG7u.132]WPO37272.1 cellulase family glycosylhydrolase [Flammeovirgaceae bacterium SG7u.111]